MRRGKLLAAGGAVLVTSVILYAVFPWVEFVVPAPAELDALDLKLVTARTGRVATVALLRPLTGYAARVEQEYRSRSGVNADIQVVYTQYLTPPLGPPRVRGGNPGHCLDGDQGHLVRPDHR